LLTDGELEVGEFNQEFAEKLKSLTPWGQAFPEPVFEGQFEVIDARQVGDCHVKMKLQSSDMSQAVDAICFGYLRDHQDLPSGTVQAIYRLDINEFRGDKSLQLIVQEMFEN